MGIRILFVEGETENAGVTVTSLERKGYEVAVARSQRQAMNRIRSQRPDILVINVASFGGNGFKVTSAIRLRLENVPAVLMLEKGQAGLADSADAHMTPPFTPRRLLHRIKAIADTLGRVELKAGPLRFDPDARVLTKGNLRVRLRPKEGALLTLFMRNQGRVLSRPEIMKQVWETEYTGDTRTLSVHVCWLREHIEDDANAPRFLRTVRGVGYRFEVPETGEE